MYHWQVKIKMSFISVIVVIIVIIICLVLLDCLLICYLMLIFPLDVLTYLGRLLVWQWMQQREEWKPSTLMQSQTLSGQKSSYSSIFNLLHFTWTLPFNPCISLLHIISCVLPVYLLQKCFSLDFKCYLNVIFKHYLKIGKDSDFGALRSHEMLPPCPFSAASKKKIRKTPVDGTVERPPYQRMTVTPLVCLCSQQHMVIHCWCQTPQFLGAGGSSVGQGEVFTCGCRCGVTQRGVAFAWWPSGVLQGLCCASRTSSVSGVS